jgi:hypothetical protein
LVRRVTVVIEGGNVGAAIALALAMRVGVADVEWFQRRDGNVQMSGVANDAKARGRWVSAMRDCGMVVAPAPWERGGHDAKP